MECSVNNSDEKEGNQVRTVHRPHDHTMQTVGVVKLACHGSRWIKGCDVNGGNGERVRCYGLLGVRGTQVAWEVRTGQSMPQAGQG
ncbi:hypothetical protein RRG08_034510 [Elysia crispata]|uniref:Uncharacterized protein n=1 Tax=Elysia crispata TaxID=231223 RepID=A0AAE1ECA8_9GAST|nr:hypothetical protein RRG08_034510 [Elysia crispata]